MQLVDVPDLAYLGTRDRVALPDLAGFIEAGIARHADEADGAPFVIFHTPVVEDSDGDVEVGVPVRPHEGAATLLRHQALAVEVRGQAARFPDVLRAYERLAVTAYVRGLPLAGPPREEYHEQSTRIVWPVS